MLKIILNKGYTPLKSPSGSNSCNQERDVWHTTPLTKVCKLHNQSFGQLSDKTIMHTTSCHSPE